MFAPSIVALLALAEPAGPAQTTDEPVVNVDEQPAPPAPEAPPAAAPEQRAPLPAVPAPPPAPPSAETVGETEPARPPSPPPVRPSAGFGLEIGYAHGGDRFLTVVGNVFTPASNTSSANAGDGLFVALAGNWMSYWSGSGVGLGVYARAGVKYSGVGDGTTTMAFMRCPLGAGAQLLLPIGARWFALGRLGVMTEVLAQLNTQGGGVSHTSADFAPRLGEFADAGVYWAASEHSGLALIARYERIDVSYAGDVINADNVGALAATYLRF
jgi:hypothetical protein